VRDRTLDDWNRHGRAADPKPLPGWLSAGVFAVLTLGAVHLAFDEWRREAAWRSQAESICTQNPETYQMYPLDGTMPMDSQYDYCVAAHLSHMPGPD
jgi:hypothetical protein